MAIIYFDMANANLGTGQGNFAVRVKGKKETQYFTSLDILKEMVELMGVSTVRYGGDLEELAKAENAA